MTKFGIVRCRQFTILEGTQNTEKTTQRGSTGIAVWWKNPSEMQLFWYSDEKSWKIHLKDFIFS